MRFFRTLLTATALVALAVPSFAQDASELTLRINRLEQHVRELTGRNEEYAHQIRLLEQQVQQLGGTPLTAGPQTQMAPQPGVPQTAPGAPPHGATAYPPQQPSIGSSDPDSPAPGPENLGTLPSGPA